VASDGTHLVSLGEGFLPTWSPDGATIAFLRDPLEQKPWTADPGLLQIWLENPDGSGLMKLAQQAGCCLGARPNIEWLRRGARTLLTGTRHQMIDVATGE
jgi:Tol biopolymer transport system component